MAQPDLRVLLDSAATGVAAGETTVTDDELAELYAVPRRPWLRANMVSSVDGAATGDDGVSGSVNNDVDRRVFGLLRDLADAIVVGAGTARAEGYSVAVRPLVLVSRSGDVPERLRGAEPGRVLMATCASAPGLDAARSALGATSVLVLGDDTVDLPRLPLALADRGLVSLLCEGGPHLLGDLLDHGLVDELCLTTTPRLAVGEGPRITRGGPVDTDLELRLLLESQGTLLQRWYVRRSVEGT